MYFRGHLSGRLHCLVKSQAFYVFQTSKCLCNRLSFCWTWIPISLKTQQEVPSPSLRPLRADVHITCLTAWIPQGFYCLLFQSCGSESITSILYKSFCEKHKDEARKRKCTFLELHTTTVHPGGHRSRTAAVNVETEKQIWWHLTGVTKPTKPEHRLVICGLCQGQFQTSLLPIAAKTPAQSPREAAAMRWVRWAWAAFGMMPPEDVTLPYLP